MATGPLYLLGHNGGTVPGIFLNQSLARSRFLGQVGIYPSEPVVYSLWHALSDENERAPGIKRIPAFCDYSS